MLANDLEDVRLVGRTVSTRFPGYGTYIGTVDRINDAGAKYIVKYDGDPNEYEYTAKKTRKMLQPAR